MERNANFCSKRFGLCLSVLKRLASNFVKDCVKSDDSDGLKTEETLLYELCFVNDGDFCLAGFSSQMIRDVNR